MNKAKHNYSLGKYKTVTADEMAQVYSKSVRLNERMFSCIECGEYVTFVRGEKVRPYFKHSKRNETTEYCKLRSGNLQSDSIYEKLGLPLYLGRRGKEKGQFDLYMVFYSLDRRQMDLARRENLKITIISFDEDERLSIPHIVNSDKFPLGLTTLIRIDFVSNRYKIKYSSSNAAKSLIPRWGSDAEGITKGGALFTYGPHGGRKIRVNDEVTTNRDYYYLCQTLNFYAGMDYEEQGEIVLKSDQSYVTYDVYKICFTPHDRQQFKKLAEFCKDILKVNLVEQSSKLTPIWPPVIHKEDDELNYLEREFEALFILETEEENAGVYLHTGNSINEFQGKKIGKDQYLVTLPIHKQRTAVMINESCSSIYSFLNQYRGTIKSFKNGLTIKDMFNNPLDTGIHDHIPPKRKIRVLSTSRCDVVQINHNQIRSKTRIRDTDGVILRGITYGDEIVVLFGSGTVRLVSFRKSIKNNQITTFDYDLLYKQLKKMGPPLIVPPLWLKRLLKGISRNTKLFGLIREYIFTNKIPTDAYKVLAALYGMKEESDRGED